VGIPAGATIWSDAAPPLNAVGTNGDYYLNTSTYCVYGPKAAGVWPSTCVSSVRQLGYVAENTGNKGTPGGYTPLDANALVPAANLPAIAAINGTSVPSNNASDQTVVTTAPSVGAWAALPACPDTGGNHLNYSSVTHGFLCGNTGGTAGSVFFGGVGSGTNANALLVGGSLSYIGAGQVNANQLSGVSLASLSTGLLKNTAGTGVPSVAASSDVTSTLGFTPENSANKGATGGYAPLGAGTATVPLANLPTIPYAQLSGAPLSLSPNGTAAGDLSGSYPNPSVTRVNGVALSGLSTGIVKNTTGTGAPTIATSSDVANTLGFTPENPANKGAASGYAPLNTSSQVPLANLPTIPYAQTSGVQASLGFTPASYPGAGVPASTGGAWGTSYTVGTGAGNLVQLNGASQLPAVSAALLTNWPTFNQSTTGTAAGLNGVLLSGLATGLLKNTTSTGAPSVAVDGTDFVSPATLNGATLPASVTTVATTSNITSGGNIYANNGSSTAGCLQFGDTGPVHTTGLCAPSSGVNVLWNLPATSDSDGQSLLADGSHNLLWSSYWTMPHLTGLVTFAPPPATSGTPTLFTVTAPAHTTLAAGTEANDLYFNLNRTVQFTGGTTIASQRAALFASPAYSFTTSTTISNAATVAIGGPPSAGTNATIATGVGLWVQTNAVGSGETAAYAARFDAPTGATNNYSAYLNGTAIMTGGLVKNTGTNSTFTVEATSSQTVPLLQIQNSSAANQVTVDKNFNVGAPVITGTQAGTAPTLACNTTNETGAGTTGSPTCTLSGTSSDVSGLITLTTGGSPAASAKLLAFTFGNTHTAAPGACHVLQVGSPISTIAQTPYMPATGISTTTGWFLNSGSTALAATTTYYFSYICI